MSIKLCIMSPIEYLSVFSIRGDMLMALPHLVKQSENYRNFFKSNEKKIILDSGVIELGTPVQFSELLSMGLDVGADMIAIPDYLYDANKTINIAKNINRKYLKKKHTEKYKFMGIVQGETLSEWLNCFVVLANLEMVSTLGIGIYSVKKVFSSLTGKRDCFSNRMKCMEIITRKNLLPKGKEIHLLGLGEPRELVYQKEHPFVRSCDTSRPILYGMQKRRYTVDGRIVGEEYDGPKMDYYSRVPLSCYSDIIYNIEILKKMCE